MALKLKFRSLFPASVRATSPLTLVKNGLSYVFGLDITALRDSIFSSDTTVNGTVTIHPTPGTFNRGIDISQTSPVGGSVAGPKFFNLIDVTDQGFTVTGGTTKDPFGLANVNAVGARISYTVTGDGLRGAAVAAIRVQGSGAGSYYGFAGSAYTNVVITGGLWGNIGVGQIGAAGSAPFAIGIEGEVAVAPGGLVLYRTAVVANSQGPVSGSLLDAAFVVNTGPDAGSAPFSTMFALSANMFGGQLPLKSTATIFSTDTALTISDVFPFSTVTLTGKFADFPNFTIDATGRSSWGVPLASLPASYGLGVSGTSKGRAGFGVSTNTTTGASFADIINSSGTADVALLSNEAARTTVRYGRTLGSYAELSAFSGNGLIIGTAFSAPLIFGANNTFAASVTGSQWAMGADVSPIAGPILSLNQNTAAPTIAVDATPALDIVGATNGFAGLQSQAFGSGQNVWTMRSAFTSAAAPSQVNALAVVSTIQSRALDNTGAYRTIVALDAITLGAITSTDWGGRWRVRTGTPGSGALVERVSVGLGLSVGSSTDPGLGNFSVTGGVQFGSFTVATLPTGVTGKAVWCSNARVFNGAGTQEGAGVGTGGLATYNGTAWKLAGTNTTTIA